MSINGRQKKTSWARKSITDEKGVVVVVVVERERERSSGERPVPEKGKMGTWADDDDVIDVVHRL